MSTTDFSTDVAPREGSARKPRRWKRWVLVIAILLGVVVVLAGIKALQIKTMIDAGKAMAIPPETVGTTKANTIPWQPEHPQVATLIAYRQVTLSAEVTGTVREIDFENGGTVKKGQVLIRLDTSTEEAQLAAATADAALARQSLARAAHLRQGGAGTQSDLDAAQARDQQARAQVTNLETVIGKKVIKAPFDGRVGIRSVELGQVVAPGTAIVTLQTVSPIYAQFEVPQQELSELKVGEKVRLQVDAFPQQNWEGEVTTIEPTVDPNTRSTRVRATVQNPDGRLTNGMFARVEVESSEKGNALVVPATSLVFAPYGDSVYVVEQSKDPAVKGLVARQRFVRLGDRRGDFVAVTSGLKDGEEVVSSGAFKLRNGQGVVVNNEHAPTPQLAPKPEEQ